MVAVLIGMALVFRFFPKKERRARCGTPYHAQDTGGEGATRSAPVHVPRPGARAGARSGHIAPPGES